MLNEGTSLWLQEIIYCLSLKGDRVKTNKQWAAMAARIPNIPSEQQHCLWRSDLISVCSATVRSGEVPCLTGVDDLGLRCSLFR